MSRPIAYIAGPMTGLPEFNYPAFDALAAQLEAKGWAVLNPTRKFEGRVDLPYEVYLRGSIVDVLSADAIVLLPGWTASRGAQLEKHIADALGLPAYVAEEFA